MSTETKHTPGPWTYFTHFLEDGTRATDDSDEPRMRFILGADRQGLAHTVGLSGGRDAANARLIAAAPAMFEALDHLHGDILDLETDCSIGTNDGVSEVPKWVRERLSVMVAAARAALAQARGAT